jgi:predicted permease
MSLSSTLKRLRRKPLRASATALTLALGIGATTAAFAAVDGVLLQELPVSGQDELVVAWFVNPARELFHIPFSPSAFDLAVRGTGSLSGVAGVERAGARPTVVESGSDPYVLSHVRVAGDFFGVLGARPAAGRLLTLSDDDPGAEAAVVLAHGTWVAQFGADPSVLGSTLRYGDRSFTIVGVAPEGFDFPQGTDLWATLRGSFPSWAEEEPVGIELDILGRRRPGVDAATVAADLTDALRADPGISAVYSDLRPVVTPFHDHVVGSVRPVLRAGLAAATLLLLVAVANATLLLLAGGPAVAHELAVNRALGAGRIQLLWRVVAEAGIVGALGVAGGLGLAWIGLQILLPLAPGDLPRLDNVALDGRSVAIAILLGLLGTGLAGMVAGLGLVRTDPGASLSAGGRGQLGIGSRAQRLLAAIQLSLTVVSAVGAGLLVRTVDAMDAVELGFEAEDLSVVSLSVPYPFFEVPETYVAALEQVVRDLEGRAGILSVRPTLSAPLGSGLDVILRAEGQEEEDLDENPYLAVDAVLPGHFEALGVPIRSGRGLTEADNAAGSDPVVVVNEAAARALWPGRDPIGERAVGFPDEDMAWTVVGVVADTRYREFFDARPSAYFPLGRMRFMAPTRLLIRTAEGGPITLGAVVREAFAGADPLVKVMGEEPVEEALRRASARQRFAAGVLLSFAWATLLLAALGVYGVFTVWVQGRTGEMAVRLAMGATRPRVVGMVLAGVLRVALVGAGAGVAIALWVSRLVEALLFGVSPLDPGTYVFVTMASLGTALAAGLVPAFQAARADPALTLQSE